MGGRRGQQKKVKRFPVISSRRIGLVEMPFAFSVETSFSMSETENAKCLNP